MKYIISPYFELFDKPALDQTDWFKAYSSMQIVKEEEAVLLDKKKEVLYVVNPVIRQFIQGFQQPAKVKSVAKHLAAQVGCDVEELKDTVVEFMDDMYDMGVLVTKKKHKKLQKSEHQLEQNRFEEGTILADYRIEKVLAKKTNVTIYLAKNLKTEEEIVIKAQELALGLKPKKRKQIKKKYLQEFLLIEEVHQHEGVCSFIEFIELENALLAVIEYVKGVALKKILKHRKLSLNEKLFVLVQFIDVMAYLHKKEVIHGDLHSSNLLVTEDLKIKLIDFNLSNHAEPHQWEILREGGVYQYLPPEKISDSVIHVVSGRADFQSEVFQIGVMIYLLLYQKMPFSGSRYKELGEAIKRKEVELPKYLSTGEQIPDPVLSLLKTCLEKKPSKRFKSAVQLNQYYLKHKEMISALK